MHLRRKKSCRAELVTALNIGGVPPLALSCDMAMGMFDVEFGLDKQCLETVCFHSGLDIYCSMHRHHVYAVKYR
jgi:hypothetical protein